MVHTIKLWNRLYLHNIKYKNVNFISYQIHIEFIPEITRVLHYLIYPVINTGVYSNGYFVVSLLWTNGSTQLKVTYMDGSYSPVYHVDSFIINISISVSIILEVRVLDVSYTVQNINVPMNEQMCITPPP